MTGIHITIFFLLKEVDQFSEWKLNRNTQCAEMISEMLRGKES